MHINFQNSNKWKNILWKINVKKYVNKICTKNFVCFHYMQYIMYNKQCIRMGDMHNKVGHLMNIMLQQVNVITHIPFTQSHIHSSHDMIIQVRPKVVNYML